MQEKIYISVVLLLFPLLLTAQNVQQQGAVITFKETTFDFGDVFKEDEKVVSAVFEFENTGTEDLIIVQVLCSSTNTSPSWTKTPISPNGKGIITISCDPRSNGYFHHSATVKSNAIPNPVILHIKGYVARKNDIMLSYTKRDYDFGEMTENTEVSHTFEFINNSNDTLFVEDYPSQELINWQQEQDAYISDYSKIVEPNGKGFVMVVCKPQKTGLYHKNIRFRSYDIRIYGKVVPIEKD